MSELMRSSPAEIVEAEEVIEPGLGDASEKDAAMWPLKEARYRMAAFIAKYPGYAEEGTRALGYVDLAEAIFKALPHRTYGDYGHTA